MTRKVSVLIAFGCQWVGTLISRPLLTERQRLSCRTFPKALVIKFKSVRRAFILALALNLAGLVSLPLSACALSSSKPVECATAETQSRCHNMNMRSRRTQLVAAPDKSCCFTSSQAPLPEWQYTPSDHSLTAVPPMVLDPLGTPSIEHQQLARVVPDLPPPSLQPLLCTFLI